MDSQNAIAFIDNHDNQRGHGAGGSQIVTFREDVLYNMVNAFELAWSYGYVRLMSSYIWPIDVQVRIHFPFVSHKELKCKGRLKNKKHISLQQEMTSDLLKGIRLHIVKKCLYNSDVQHDN